jgi:hypothetical protein
MSRNCCDTNLDCYTMSRMSSFDYIKIFYQNIRGLHTKCTNFYDSVCVSEPKIIYITETWLNDLFYNHCLFPNVCSVFCADQDYMDPNLTCCGGVLVAVHHYVCGCIHKYDLELTDKYI